MTKDPIAEAKREGWNEAIEAAASNLEGVQTASGYNAEKFWREYERGLCIDRIRSLHKPTEESEM